ncbi:uncharacterized protein LOC124460865 [Drosophila willistoni]|uniref:uncharacterized protein LOC124460865 n=1 Tax=Drosophila willistoni TaxID=7260 RepID=UPI001F084ADD|nr:uncharacterized protein LOC124460865 [Drosophila willistoni]
MSFEVAESGKHLNNVQEMKNILIIFSLISYITDATLSSDGAEQKSNEPEINNAVMLRQIMTEVQELKGLVTTQTAMIKQMMRMMNQEETPSIAFPISNAEQLILMESKLGPDNRKHFVKKITLIVSQAAPGKSIRQVLADDLIVSHNVDGRNGKYSFKAYPNFLSVLLESIQNSHPGDPPENTLRTSLACAKNTFNKQKNRNKNVT